MRTDTQIYRQRDGRKNSHEKLKVDFRNSARAPKNPFLQTPWKNEMILSFVDIFSSYREVNTPFLGYRNKNLVLYKK